MRFLKPCLLLMAVLLSGALSAAAQTTLARKGKPVARIVAADGSSVNRRAAAGRFRQLAALRSVPMAVSREKPFATFATKPPFHYLCPTKIYAHD